MILTLPVEIFTQSLDFLGVFQFCVEVNHYDEVHGLHYDDLAGQLLELSNLIDMLVIGDPKHLDCCPSRNT